jgi:hypothetical protein
MSLPNGSCHYAFTLSDLYVPVGCDDIINYENATEGVLEILSVLVV